MSFTDVVGRGGNTASTPPVTPKKPATGLTKNIADRLAAGGYTIDVNIGVDEAIASLTLAQKRQIAAVLDRAGFNIRSIGEIDYVLSNSFPNLQWSDFSDLLGQIKEQLVTTGGEKEKPELARNIVKYDETVLKEVAQSIALNKIGKSLTDEELQGAIDLANSMISKGTVTRTKNVRNKKTGKLEQITETTPGFSQERFGVELGQKLEQESPQLVERRKAFEFVDEMSKILSGGM